MCRELQQEITEKFFKLCAHRHWGPKSDFRRQPSNPTPPLGSISGLRSLVKSLRIAAFYTGSSTVPLTWIRAERIHDRPGICPHAPMSGMIICSFPEIY